MFDGVLMERLILSVEDGFTTENACYLVSDGAIEIFLPPFSAAVLRTRKAVKKESVQPKKKKRKWFARRRQYVKGSTWKNRNRGS